MSVISSSIESTIRAAFPFSVDKFRLSGPDNCRTDHFGLFRSDDGQCIGAAVRETYVPHTVDDICTLAQAASAAFDEAVQVKCHWREGHCLSIAPSVEHRRAIYGTQDNIFPRLIISAGYDAQAFRASLGFYRDACRNMARLKQVGRGVDCSIKHTLNMHYRLNELTDKFRLLASNWGLVADTAVEMESRQVQLADFLRQVYPESESTSTRSRNNSEKRIEAIFSRVLSEREATGRPALGGNWIVSAWEAFNAVQGYVQHVQPRRGNITPFDRVMMAMDDEAVNRAESLAMAS